MSIYVNGSNVAIGRFVGSPQLINLGVVSANVQLLPNTNYRLWSSVDCFFVQGVGGSVSCNTSQHPLTAKLDVLIFTGISNSWLAAVVASGTGVLFISQLDPTDLG